MVDFSYMGKGDTLTFDEFSIPGALNSRKVHEAQPYARRFERKICSLFGISPRLKISLGNSLNSSRV